MIESNARLFGHQSLLGGAAPYWGSGDNQCYNACGEGRDATDYRLCGISAPRSPYVRVV